MVAMTTPAVDSTVTCVGMGESSAHRVAGFGGPMFEYTVAMWGAAVAIATGGGVGALPAPSEPPMRTPQIASVANRVTARIAQIARCGVNRNDAFIPSSSRELDILTA
jgi:hypothetical protein